MLKLSREEKYGSTCSTRWLPMNRHTDCNGVITMANLTVTMTTTRRLSQEEIEALIELRVAQLRVLAAQTALEWWRSRGTSTINGLWNVCKVSGFGPELSYVAELATNMTRSSPP